MSLTHALIRVSGTVQMVGYRYFALRAAKGLGLTGCVTNEQDGSVTVVVEGERASIDELVERLSEGPSTAIVDDLRVDWSDYTGEFIEFTVEY